MIVMLDTPRKSWDLAHKEMSGMEIEQLLSPTTTRVLHDPEARFAIDNGAFANFSERSFNSLLEREWLRRYQCRFVAVPDVVGSARRTLELFEHFWTQLRGWPLAFVCQDGQEQVPVPWAEVDAIFIGGTDRFKESQAAIDCIKVAKILGKWVHVGRVNTPGRFEAFAMLGADSIDGTGIARYSHMRKAIHGRNGADRLFTAEELVSL